jgi:GH35 family endo-1,4-beta-xylanase
MKRVGIILGLLLVNSIFTLQAAKNWYDSASIRIDSLRKANFILQVIDSNGNKVSDSIIINLAKHEFVFGQVMDAETTPGSLSWDRATMYRYFNAGVAGNDFKWSGIEAQKGVLTYNNFDEILTWCEKVGWTLKGHCLLWNGHAGNYHEVPRWVQELPTATEMNDACKNRILRDVTRYKGRVFEYDVMNEPSHTFFLSTKIGDSINWNSFKWARQADSTAQLFVNDYNLIEYDEYAPFVTLVKKMIDNGAPVTGIGIQGHFGGSINTNDVKRRLDQLSVLGLPMRITEFDMAINDNKVTPANQALYYARMLRIAFSYPKITGFYFWGLIDGKVWREGSGIFKSNKEPKPAADSVYNLIHKEWSTNITAITGSEGKISFRGFLGDYNVLAKINGQWKEFKVKCNSSTKDSTIILNEKNGKIPGPKLIKGRVVAPKTIELTFDKKMADPSNQISNFEIYGRVKDPILSASLKEGDSTTIVLNVKYDFLFNYFATTAYMKGDQKAADSTLLEIYGSTPIENALPGITAAQTNTEGNQIIVHFNKDMSPISDENKDSIAIIVNSQRVSILQIELKSDSASVLLITLAQPVKSGDVIYFNYNPGNWTSTENIALVATGNIGVQNNVPSAIQKSETLKVGIYPNPVVDFCTVSLNSDYDQISIYNLLGNEVYKLNVSNQSQAKIDFRNIEKGVYFVKLSSKKGIAPVTLKINKI